MAKRLGVVPKRRLTPEEHHEWAKQLWERIDRDHSGSVTREELNCDEFQDVLRSVISPNSTEGTKSVTYARSEVNVKQAIEFCLRKADYNSDGDLSFKEFKSFLWTLRNENLAQHTANLIFALFDLDGDQTLDRDEFREVYRYYVGHHPTAVEFEAQWARLDMEGKGHATRAQYIRWLQRSANPIFNMHAPPVDGDPESPCDDLAESGGSSRRSPSGTIRRHIPAPGLLPQLKAHDAHEFRPPWNERHNKDTCVQNLVTPKPMRTYFQRPQSLPELKRFFAVHQGFEKHRRRVAVPEMPRKDVVLSNEMPTVLQGRHVPDGTMRSSKGKQVLWNDTWQTPEAMKKKKVPGSLLLRCPQDLPAFLYLGRDAPKE